MKRAIGVVVVAVVMAGCNEHPVSRLEPYGSVEMQLPTLVDASEKLDLLWVIDNSGSMCQEQAVLRENFGRFVERLDEAVLDVHIAVTTTHMEDDFALEPVARPGHLQSTPQPLPGFDTSCWQANDENGQLIEGDYTPIRQLMEAAVGCMVEPDPSLLEVTDAEIACALGCRTRALCEPDECGGVQLFPDPSSYRQFDKVLRSEDHRHPDGTLDVEAMKTAFACMSLVGMRGYGFEKGLGAVMEAVSPELTGGTPDQPLDPSAPNHGFIRNDARFGAVFVTDENDCTHDGSLSEQQGSCGDDTCDFWNHPDVEDSPLVAPELVRDAMIANLSATKSEPDFTALDVLVASIHGRSQRYEGPVVPTSDCQVDGPHSSSSCEALSLCSSQSYVEQPATCASSLGVAQSGDRYERFLRSFDEGHYFPEPGPDPDQPLTGWMCAGDFQPALVAIAEFLHGAPQGCITGRIQTCEPGGGACPAHANGQPGACVPRANSDDHFCDSHVQVRVDADAGRRGMLEQNGMCDTLADDGQCIVSPGAYTLGACSGSVSGVRIEWGSPDVARQALAGTKLELRWISTSAE